MTVGGGGLSRSFTSGEEGSGKTKIRLSLTQSKLKLPVGAELWPVCSI